MRGGASLVALVLLVGCGNSTEDYEPATTTVRTTALPPTTAPSTTLAPTSATLRPTTVPLTTAPTAYATPEEAMAAFFSPDVTYVGDCAAAPDAEVGSFCTYLWDDRGVRRVYAGGEVFSEAYVFVLLERGANGWKALDSAPFSPENDPAPPW